ncbi:acyl carrier protein [Streptomyces sp. NPDC058231]|uniref:acyl carrier protein n=1 Tax=unclassified Streptomyces TaxID=2593676 RepID=UPI0036E799A0
MTEDEDLFGAVREAWAETLDIDREAVPLEEGFFDAGGNSMLLVLLCDQLNELTGRTLRATELFQHSTVRAQVRLLAGDL